MHKFLLPVLGTALAAAAGSASARENGAPALEAVASTAEPAPEAPLDPASLELSRGIIGKIIPPERQKAMFATVLDSMTKQATDPLLDEFDDPAMIEILNRHLDTYKAQALVILDRQMPNLLEAFARAYTREFSIDELRELSAFANSPTGEHYLSRSAALLSDPDFAKANSAYIAEIYTLLPDLTKGIKDDIDAYYAEHPEAIPDDEDEVEGEAENAS